MTNASTPAQPPSIGDLIDKYIQYRQHVEAMDAAYKEKRAPYTEAMKTIENFVLAQINEMGGQSVSSAAKNTAFRSEWTSAKVDDRELFMDFVFDGRQEGFLTSHVSKEAVEEYKSGHDGQLPPGIKWDSGYQVTFRKARGT